MRTCLPRPVALFAFLLLPSATLGCLDESDSPAANMMPFQPADAARPPRTDALMPPGPPDDIDAGGPSDALPPLDAGPALPPPAPAVYVDWLDRNANPCEDFYSFACGGFKRANALGPSESIRTSSGMPSQLVNPSLVTTVDQAVANRMTSSDPEVVAIGNFYQTCMDAEKNTQPRQLLQTVAALVDAAASTADLPRVTAELRKRGVHAFFVMYAGMDPGNTKQYLLTFDQGARMLPDRDYYYGPNVAEIHGKYKEHINKLALMIGVRVDPEAVLRVEMAIAKGELTPLEKRDRVATYNKMTFAAFAALAPEFSFRGFLDALGAPTLENVNVIAPNAVKNLAAVLALPIEDIKHYLRWQIIKRKAPLLDHESYIEDHAFSSRTLLGAGPPSSRRNLCLIRTRNRFPHQIGRRFVERHMPADTKQIAGKLVALMRTAFEKRLQSNTWLDEPTRAEALGKLKAISERIAWPEPPFRITMPVTILPPLEEDLTGSMTAMQSLGSLLAGPVNHNVWTNEGGPLTVNAFYYPTYNTVYVPAAILNAPFFDARRPAVANFGGIGTVIGHEIGHAFDSNGRHGDGTGSLRDWWTPGVAAEYGKRAQCVGDLYRKIEPLPGQFVNPELTMGENLADFAGLRVAYEAYLAAGQVAEPYQGFTDKQQFFIANAQIRCTVQSPQSLSNQLRDDTHSPNDARTNVPMAHMPEFATAFNCPVGAKMRPAMTCQVW